MRDAGDAGAFVGTADVRDPAAGDRRIVMALDQQQPHAVGQGFFDDGNLLGEERPGAEQGKSQDAKGKLPGRQVLSPSFFSFHSLFSVCEPSREMLAHITCRD